MAFIAKKSKNKDLIKHKDLIQKYKDYKAGSYPPEKRKVDLKFPRQICVAIVRSAGSFSIDLLIT